MSYFQFLQIFLGIPILILSVLTVFDYVRGRWMPDALNTFKPWAAMIGLCIVALIYTTPWDNYLVATNVWWYDIELVNGLVIGWVPIEEYTFFLVQPVMTSLLFLLLARYLPLNPERAGEAGVSMSIRVWVTVAVAVLWAVMTGLLLLTFMTDTFDQFTYLALELSWALIPIGIQTAFGADILWRHRRVVGLTILISTVYLAWADSIAIASGTWTIDPAQSLPIYIGGLPIEEFIFFLITNTLVVFGMTLVLAEESMARTQVLRRFRMTEPIVNWLENHQLQPQMKGKRA